MTAFIFRSLAAQVMLVTACLGFSLSAQAAISLSGTRLIFEGKNKEASIIVRNEGSKVLVQSWIESNTPGDSGELPFAVTPPLAKMQPNGQQLLRVLYAGKSDLPTNKETVLWLNVQEVPEQVEGENTLQLAIRQRIKLFYRPAGISGTAADAATGLTWQLVQQAGKPALRVVNSSAFHVPINTVDLSAMAQQEKLSTPFMIAPGETHYLTLKNAGISPQARLSFKAVNDYGGVDTFNAQLVSGTPVQAQRATP